MRYLIDGYNVTKGDPATCGLGLEEQRSALVRRLAARGASLLGAGPITVVFDGREGAGNAERYGPVEVRYARAESADDLIVRLVRAAGEPVTLVTSDRGLAERARSAASVGIVVEPRERVFEGTRPRNGRRRPGGSTAGLPRGANRITEDLKRIWLTDDED